METEIFLMLAIYLNYITPTQSQPTLELIIEISKMLVTLRNRLLPKNSSPH